MKNPTCVYAPFLPALLIACLSAKAQNLPNVQTVNVWAPVDVKTDGKATEWANQFEAYNKNTSVFYTMANDGDKLYLTVQATDANTIAKILSGGITLSIKGANKANKALCITYPILSAKNGRSFIIMKIKGDGAIADSDLNAVNKQLNLGCKGVKVTGARGITDTLISVYNTDGIKAAGLFDHQKAYTCELAISLQYLTPYVNELNGFNYTIILNGIDTGVGGARMTILGAGMGTNPGTKALQSKFDNMASDPKYLNLTSPTYFNGKYTLVTK